MRFFELTSPEYATDTEASRANPIEVLETFSLPSVRCRRCGLWAGSSRILTTFGKAKKVVASMADGLITPDEWNNRKSQWARLLGVPLDDLVPGTDHGAITFDEWNDMKPGWARLLGIPLDDDNLVPGADLGPPQGKVTGRITHNVVHPFPGRLWCAGRVKGKLQQSGGRGFKFAKVRLSFAKTATRYAGTASALWELVVVGRAWRKGSTLAGITACSTCGRKRFPRPKSLKVDEARWDGSDVFNVDLNSNIVIVTEHFKDALENAGGNNIAFRKI